MCSAMELSSSSETTVSCSDESSVDTGKNHLIRSSFFYSFVAKLSSVAWFKWNGKRIFSPGFYHCVAISALQVRES